MNLGLHKCYSSGYLCSSNLYKIIWNKIRMASVRDFIRKNKSQWFIPDLL